jgi:hypothetical protein
MFLNEISYGTLLGGHFNGFMVFHLELTGEEDSGTEVADVLMAIRRHEKGPSRVVLLRGEFTQTNDLDLLTLVKSLRDGGYFVIAVTIGRRYHQWFKECSFVVAETEHAEWIGFEVGELWYLFESDSQPELSFPQMSKVPSLYLVPGPRTTPSGLMAFLKSAKYPWVVYLEPKQQIIEAVAYGEQP